MIRGIHVRRTFAGRKDAAFMLGSIYLNVEKEWIAYGFGSVREQYRVEESKPVMRREHLQRFRRKWVKNRMHFVRVYSANPHQMQ
jgi:hypothetical protein